MSLTRVLFVRHGESEHHVKGLTGGWTDTPLTDLGRQQIRSTAERLKSMVKGGELFCCSDLLRAQQSAEIICAVLGYEPRVMQWLREINNGVAVAGR